jgi:hypothetical protein
MGRALTVRKILFAVLTLAFGVTSGCSCDGGSDDASGGAGASGTQSNGTAQGGNGGSMGQFTDTGVGGGTPQCVNLECQQVVCPMAGVTTTVSGTVFDPSGTLPLYNVVVYVPNGTVDPIPDELTCDQCSGELSGDPLVSTITDTQGRFTLEDVPVGANIPLVIQVGKWRRQITIPSVAECVDNPLTDPNTTRLPRSMAEGNLPRIALTTGQADPLFCLLRRIGIDDSEFGVAGSPARVHFYRGANGSQQYDAGFGASPGASFPTAPTTLWDTGWTNYDIVMLSCEGSEQPGPKNGHRVALRDYLNLGGRVFATHYHYNWFQGDAPPDMQSVATFTSTQNNFDDQVDIDTTFPKGLALADWLFFVDGSSPHSHFDVVDGRRHTVTLDTNLARIWVRYAMDTIYFSFNAPIGAPEDQQCGRMVFSDIHVSAGAGSPNNPFPSACSNNPLSEQEKVLIFMLFDLSACIIPDDDPVCPPGQNPCGDAGDPPCPGQCVNGCCEEVPE